jgi:hypothetical protein
LMQLSKQSRQEDAITITKLQEELSVCRIEKNKLAGKNKNLTIVVVILFLIIILSASVMFVRLYIKHQTLLN